MNNNLKNKLLGGWGIMRLFRLGLGLSAAYFAVSDRDWMLGTLAAILLVQAFLNISCCGPNGCETGQAQTKRKSSTDEVTFEEVK